jgi:hypothetical protein
MNSRATVVGSILMATVSAVPASDHIRPLTETEARTLADAAFSKRQHALRSFGIDLDGQSEHFYFFTGTWDNPEPGSVIVGMFAVDRATADVWYSNVACEAARSSKLQRLQAQTRRALGLTEREYKVLKRSRPLELDETVRAAVSP